MNEVWLYSQLWLTGLVDYTTTNVWPQFAVLSTPQTWTMSRDTYVAMFVTINVLCVVAVGVLAIVLSRTRPLKFSRVH